METESLLSNNMHNGLVCNPKLNYVKKPVLKPFATSLATPDDLLGIVAASSTIPGILISLPAASS
jgi:hypothetical protein